MKGLAEAVDRLIKEDRIEQPSTLSIPGLQVEDLYGSNLSRFSPAAQKALAVKATSLIHERRVIVDIKGQIGYILWQLLNNDDAFMMWENSYVDIVDTVKFIGLRVNDFNFDAGVDKVIYMINDLASHGYVTASLASLITLEFYTGQLPREHGVLSYVALTAEGIEYLEKNYPEFNLQEGGMPVSWEKK